MVKTAQRKEISPSLRWSIFARDGFTCRYCGVQAGQNGVELHADHVLSRAEGGDDSFDNLVTACQKCNNGKRARSLRDAPTSAQIIQRINDRTRNLEEQADAIAASVEAQKNLQQQAVNLKCTAYVKTTTMEQGEVTIILNFCKRYGADLVMEWYRIAAGKVGDYKAIRYVCGIARNYRKQQGLDE